MGIYRRWRFLFWIIQFNPSRKWGVYFKEECAMGVADIIVTSVFVGAAFGIPITRIVMLIKERRK